MNQYELTARIVLALACVGFLAHLVACAFRQINKARPKWRALEVGEVIKPGDELTCVTNPPGRGWAAVGKLVGERVKANDGLRYRRRVEESQ